VWIKKIMFTTGNIKYADGTIHKNVLIINFNFFDAEKIRELSEECKRNRKSSNHWFCENCRVRRNCWCHKKSRMFIAERFDSGIVKWRQEKCL
jgi:hypothetical protein